MTEGGYGLFADKTFFPGDIISIYIGYKKIRDKHSSVYSMEYSKTEIIDTKVGIINESVLYLGCHFANDRSYRGDIQDRRKKYNAKFVDFKLQATSNMKKDKEILVDDNLQYISMY